MQEDPQAALLCKGKMEKGTPEKNGWTEGETLHTVPLSIEVLVKRAGRPGPQLEERRVPVQSQSWEGPGA